MRCNTLLGRFVRNRMAARPRRNIRAFWSIGNLLHAGADVSEQQSSDQWFQATSWSNEIKPITVTKYTDSSVWVNGRRRDRVTTYEGRFQSKSAAWDWLESLARREYESAQMRADSKFKHLERILIARGNANE
jgi:hypothetical protein